MAAARSSPDWLHSVQAPKLARPTQRSTRKTRTSRLFFEQKRPLEIGVTEQQMPSLVLLPSVCVLAVPPSHGQLNLVPPQLHSTWHEHFMAWVRES